MFTFNLVKPNKTNWKTEIDESKIIKQIKRPIVITFSSDIPLEDISTYGKLEPDYNKISLLKSNIQKAVRRNLPDVAVSSAIEIIKYKTGLLELLRRLCVIIVEDKFGCYFSIADHYNSLVWIMATEKAWEGWLQWLLKLIYFICDKNFKNINCDSIDYKWSDNEYSRAMLIRSFYGGLKCDILLLKNCAKIIEKMEIPQSKEIDLVLPDNNLRIIKESVDFHCVPGIIKNIYKKYPKYTESEIKESIWTYSSSIRFDCDTIPENECWEDIKETVSWFQKWYLRKLGYKEYNVNLKF